MVSSTYLSTSDARRYPTRVMAPYSPTYQDRRDTYVTQEIRSAGMSERDTVEETPSQRKRIAVACGRCRKRKIRCSGDSGNGQPCLNCKNAGVEPCQFLRVSSQEAPMKVDGLPYTIDLSRQYQGRPGMPTLLPTISPYMEGVNAQADMAYRSGPTSYPYNGKGQYYPGQGFPGSSYSEEQCGEYPVYPSYQPVQDPGYMMGGYRSMGPGQVAVKGCAPLYVETDASYGYSTGPGPSVAHRQTHSGDSPSYSFQSVDVSSSSNSSDRMTPPNSVSRRALPVQQQQHLVRNDSMSPSYSKHSHSHPHSHPSTAGASPTSPPAGFGSFDGGAGVPGYPVVSSLRGQSDMYTTAPSDAMPDSPHRGGVPEYRYTDTRPEAMAAGYMSQGSHHHNHHHHHHHHHAGHHDHYMIGETDGVELDRKPARPVLRG